MGRGDCFSHNHHREAELHQKGIREKSIRGEERTEEAARRNYSQGEVLLQSTSREVLVGITRNGRVLHNIFVCVYSVVYSMVYSVILY